MNTPIENLRNEHRHCSCWGENCAVKRHPNEDWDSHCFKCAVTWPCDTIAALDALEEQDALQAENARLRESLNEACDWLKRLQEAYDPTDTEDGIVEIERLRKGGEGQ